MRRILISLIFVFILTGCQANSHSHILPIKLPEFPKGNKEVGEELIALCGNDIIKCKYLLTYLNNLYLFQKQYDIYRVELDRPFYRRR